jgi:hypothetical protein
VLQLLLHQASRRRLPSPYALLPLLGARPPFICVPVQARSIKATEAPPPPWWLAWRPFPVPVDPMVAAAPTGEDEWRDALLGAAPTSPSTLDEFKPGWFPTAFRFGCASLAWNGGAARGPLLCLGRWGQPLCIIDRSSSIDQAEAALRCALLVSIGGNRPVVIPQQMLDKVARVFNVNVSSMMIRATTPKHFLLSLPDFATADAVFNRGLALHGPGFSLLFKRCTRFDQAVAASLPVLATSSYEASRRAPVRCPRCNTSLVGRTGSAPCTWTWWSRGTCRCSVAQRGAHVRI